MPIQEIGADVNDALLNNIVKLSEDQSYKALQAARSQQYIEGKARVARNESLVDIRNEQGTLDKIFGNATVQGALAQTGVQMADTFSLHLNENMDKFKGMTSDQFVKAQVDYVKQNLLKSDDPATNDYMTLIASEVISRAGAVQAKHHEKFIQEDNKTKFETGLSKASTVFTQGVQDPLQSATDLKFSLGTLIERGLPLPGQHADAHKNSLLSVIINDLKSNKSVVYDGLIKGSVNIRGEEVPINSPVQFNADELGMINEEYKKYQDRTNVEAKMNMGMSLAVVDSAASDPSVGMTSLVGIVKDFFDKNGADAATELKVASWYNTKTTANAAEKSALNGIRSIEDGTAKSNPDRGAVTTDMGGYTAAIMKQANEKAFKAGTTGEASAIMADATNVVISRNLEQQAVTPQWKAKWNTSMSVLKTEDGKPSATFIEGYNDFNSKRNSKYEGAKDLYEASIDKATLANIDGVRYYTEGGMSIEDAVIKQSINQMDSTTAKEFLTNPDKKNNYRKKIQAFIKDPDERGFFLDILGDDWKPILDNAGVQASLEQAVVSEIAATGVSGTGTMSAAIKDWKKRYDQVSGRAVPNHGVPLTQQTGVRDPTIKFKKIVDYYLNTRGGESALEGEQKIGTGFLPDKADIRIEGRNVAIYPKDSNGDPVQGVAGMAYRVPLKELGRIYTNEVIDMAILEKLPHGPMAVTRLINNILKPSDTDFMATPLKDLFVMDEELDVTITKGKDIVTKPLGLLADPLNAILGTNAPKAVSPTATEVIQSEVMKIKKNLIRTPGKVGKVTVDAAVNRVEEVLGGTNGLLSRIAKVESNNGTHPDTFNGVSNGIWQVDDIGLEDTKRMTPAMQDAHAKIKDAFGIDWKDVTEEDLKKPLYSALAGRLHLLQFYKDDYPIPESVEEQAVYWKVNYNRSKKGTSDVFLERLQG